MTVVKFDRGQCCEGVAVVVRSRRERKKQEVYDRLLEAAWRLFGEQGYDETTVAEIAEAADVAKGTFFNHFPTKESLAEALLSWRIGMLRGQVPNPNRKSAHYRRQSPFEGSDRQVRSGILRVLVGTPWLTAGQLGEKTGAGRERVKRIAEDLRREGFLHERRGKYAIP